MRAWRRWLLVVPAVAAVGYGDAGRRHRALPAGPGGQLGESEVGDHARFPARRVAAGPTRFRFHRPPGGEAGAMAAMVANLPCGTVLAGLEPSGCDRENADERHR